MEFSVVIATKDRRALLEGALASLQAQANAPTFEVIVVQQRLDRRDAQHGRGVRECGKLRTVPRATRAEPRQIAQSGGRSRARPLHRVLRRRRPAPRRMARRTRRRTERRRLRRQRADSQRRFGRRYAKGGARQLFARLSLYLQRVVGETSLRTRRWIRRVVRSVRLGGYGAGRAAARVRMPLAVCVGRISMAPQTRYPRSARDRGEESRREGSDGQPLPGQAPVRARSSRHRRASVESIPRALSAPRSAAGILCGSFEEFAGAGVVAGAGSGPASGRPVRAGARCGARCGAWTLSARCSIARAEESAIRWLRRSSRAPCGGDFPASTR